MKKALAVSLLACMTLSASAQLHGLSYQGGSPPWPATTLNMNSYAALAPLSGVPNQIFGARVGGGLDVIANYGSGWGTYPVLGGTYHTLAVNNGAANYAFGAKPGGGVDALYYFGGWNAVEINPHSFVSLANISSANQFMGVRSDGRLEFTYYNGGPWANYLVGTDLYSEVIYDPMNGGGTSVYGLRADGGIDRVTFNGSSWVTTTVDHSRVYVALTAERTVANWVYGATANGLYDIVDSGGGFNAYLVSPNSYEELEHITGTTYQLFGARADGSGLDAIYFDGGSWTSYQANPNNYDILLHDAYTTGLYAAMVPEPGTVALLGLGGLMLFYRRKQA